MDNDLQSLQKVPEGEEDDDDDVALEQASLKPMALLQKASSSIITSTKQLISKVSTTGVNVMPAILRSASNSSVFSGGSRGDSSIDIEMGSPRHSSPSPSATVNQEVINPGNGNGNDNDNEKVAIEMVSRSPKPEEEVDDSQDNTKQQQQQQQHQGEDEERENELQHVVGNGNGSGIDSEQKEQEESCHTKTHQPQPQPIMRVERKEGQKLREDGSMKEAEEIELRERQKVAMMNEHQEEEEDEIALGSEDEEVIALNQMKN